ncbi:hypothetical protein MASR2M66_02810 [Chloroflexota bacterium]
MPNWAENELTITGPDVQKILNTICSESSADDEARTLDFDKIIPYPKIYKELDQRSNEYQEKFLAIAKDDPERQDKLNALAAEYGVEPGTPWLKDGFNSGGYDWCCENWGCYDDKTEVLTRDGWKYFREVTPDDEFFTINKDGVIEIHKSLGYIEKPYSGTMFHFKTRLMDIMVSPDHSMYVTSPRGKTYQFVDAKDISYCRVKIKQTGVWNGIERDKFVLPAERRANRTFQERHLCMDDFLEFLGYYLSEGSLNKRSCKRGGYQYYVRITQHKQENRSKIIECVNRLQLKMYDYGKDITINDFQLYLYLERLGYSFEKYIPRDIKDLSARQLRILLDALMLGDGTKTKSGGLFYYTTSNKLADDMQEIGLKVEKIASISIDDRQGTISSSGHKYNHPCKIISFYSNSNKVGSCVLKKQITKEFYDGWIYCVVVPNHTLFVRRNGKVAWCGNTKWNARGISLTTRKDNSKEPSRKTVQCSFCQTVNNTEHMTVWVCQQCGSPLPDSQPLLAFMEFDTAWSPPIPVIEKLASMFSDHAFELKYFEGGMGFSGHARWSEGVEQFHHQYDYDGPRGG